MANRIHIEDDLSVDVEALRDMFKPIARELNLELPAYPQVPIDVSVDRAGETRHVTLAPSQIPPVARGGRPPHRGADPPSARAAVRFQADLTALAAGRRSGGGDGSVLVDNGL